MTAPVEALKAAKYHAEKADATASKTDIGLSIAFALIALCERWDKAVDKDGILHVNAMNFDAYRELV